MQPAAKSSVNPIGNEQTLAPLQDTVVTDENNVARIDTTKAHVQSGQDAQDAQIERSKLHLPTSHAESRLDVVTGRRTIFAPKRDQRPADFISPEVTLQSDGVCPFCSGHESETPPALWQGNLLPAASLTSPGKRYEVDTNPSGIRTDWAVRVVSNKFPAVSTGVTSEVREQFSSADDAGMAKTDLMPSTAANGGHEVIIESPNHVKSLIDVGPLQTEMVFVAYRDRLRHYRDQTNVAYASVFKNAGHMAGASLAHSHSQLLATDFVPRPIQRAFSRMKQHRAKTGCCLTCDLVREERRLRSRVICRDQETIAFCPFASHLPMMVRITTLEHAGCFEDLDDASLASVSRMAYRVISWLEKICPGTAYNYCLNTRPFGIKDPSDAFHWTLDVFPRLTQVAGFEWSTGCMINPTLPEDAAARFRQCAKREDPRQNLSASRR